MSPVVRFVLAAALPLCLAACGVPDLVAHGVKSYEHSQGPANNTPAAGQPVNASSSTSSSVAQPSAVRRPPSSSATGSEGDFVPAPAPQRETVTAEPLR